jgi:hypothetical protein
MDSSVILAETYNLFLVSDIIENESDIDRELEGLLVNKDYNNMAKTIIYILVYTVNNHLVYENIKQAYIDDAIDLLYMIDRIGFDNERIIKKFIKLLYQFYSYSLQNRINFIADKEKREFVKAKLDELVHMTQWEQ